MDVLLQCMHVKEEQKLNNNSLILLFVLQQIAYCLIKLLFGGFKDRSALLSELLHLQQTQKQVNCLM